MWFLYIIECSDSSLYTGITTDVDRRVKEHNDGTGSKYTRSRRPVRLLSTWEYANRSEASKAEYETKRLSREEKLDKVGRNEKS